MRVADERVDKADVGFRPVRDDSFNVRKDEVEVFTAVESGVSYHVGNHCKEHFTALGFDVVHVLPSVAQDTDGVGHAVVVECVQN